MASETYIAAAHLHELIAPYCGNKTVTLYTFLGVERNATAEDIKRVYHELARVYHPDKTQGTDLHFRLIQSSVVTLLGDRESYESYLHDEALKVIFERLFSFLKPWVIYNAAAYVLIVLLGEIVHYIMLSHRQQNRRKSLNKLVAEAREAASKLDTNTEKCTVAIPCGPSKTNVQVHVYEDDSVYIADLNISELIVPGPKLSDTFLFSRRV